MKTEMETKTIPYNEQSLLSAGERFQRAMNNHKAGRTDAAISEYQSAVMLDPECAEAHHNLGILYSQQKKWSQAVDCFQLATALKPSWIPALANFAAALMHCRRHDQAVSVYRRLLELQPDHHDALVNLGSLHIRMKQFPLAIDLLSQAAKHWPDDHLILNNLGLAHHLNKQLDLAVDAFETAIALEPRYVKSYHNLGNVYLDLQDIAATTTYYRKALDLTPKDAEAHFNMAQLYFKQLDLTSARRHFQTSTDLNPHWAEAWLDLAKTALMQGDYKAGWKHFCWRFKTDTSRIHTYPYQYDVPEWDGSPFEGQRLLVHCEQGLGDTIQFARFLPLIKALGGRVTFQVQKQLLPLFEHYPGIDRLQVMPEKQPESIEEDLTVALMDTPGHLDIALETIPSVTPYLFADLRKTLQWRQHICSNRLKVGIVWSGNPMYAKDKQRSCGLENFLRLKTNKGIELFCLQKEPTDAERCILSKTKEIVHLGDHFVDFSDTAAALANLDLVITVCTSIAHLAGAMGKRTWVLLSHLPDWRWMLHRSDSPWYPTVKLIRQPAPGDWDSVFEIVEGALEAIVQTSDKSGTGQAGHR
jgi:tetratricopeptide (TPR) repeat protein/ADP-heptose:LPS heptosyltransferase